MFTVLFLCTGNSARSQLAEAIFQHLADDGFQVFSAGTKPQPVDERVYQVLDERRIASEPLHSKSLQELPVEHFDFVITLCDNAKDECALYPESEALIHWDLADPKPLQGLLPFQQVADQLEEYIRLFLKLNSPGVLTDGTAPVDLFKILSDSTRLRILMLIEDEQELCVSELTEALQEIQPKVSRHLAQMRSLKILEVRRQAQQAFYHLAESLPQWVRQILTTTRAGNPAMINDEKKRLKAMTDRPERNP